jgi:hypothetical protein
MKYIISWTEHIRYNAIVDWPDDIEQLRKIVHCYPGSSAVDVCGSMTKTHERWDQLRYNALPEYGNADSFEVEPYEHDQNSNEKIQNPIPEVTPPAGDKQSEEDQW